MVCQLPTLFVCGMHMMNHTIGTVVLYPCVFLLTERMGRALDLRSTGRGFKSYSGQKLRNNLWQVVHTYIPLSLSSRTWYWPRGSDALRLGR